MDCALTQADLSQALSWLEASFICSTALRQGAVVGGVTELPYEAWAKLGYLAAAVQQQLTFVGKQSLPHSVPTGGSFVTWQVCAHCTAMVLCFIRSRTGCDLGHTTDLTYPVMWVVHLTVTCTARSTVSLAWHGCVKQVLSSATVYTQRKHFGNMLALSLCIVAL